uniref:Hydrophobic seed protein domain-containing protein n=1 Tax=Oryza sativa subsp. japonica TaxID=39947 RepID=Q6ZCV5_ORYSJ|nr:hypothetical protein [Oryza sativa Japonica Group]
MVHANWLFMISAAPAAEDQTQLSGNDDLMRIPFSQLVEYTKAGEAAGEDVGDSAGCCLRRGGVGEDEGVGGRRRAVRWRGDTGEGALRGSPAWGTTTAWRTSSSIRTRISVSSASSGSSTPVAASDSNNSAMPSDLTVSRASEWRATLAMSSRSGWIEAVVVGRAAQGAPVQPAAIGAGEGAATAPELRRRVRQPRRRGRPTSARRWSASWWAKRTRASYSGMARTGGSGTPGCSSGRRAWRWPGSPACLQSAPPRLVRRTQPPSPRTSTPGSRSSTQAEWDDGAVGGVGGGGSAPAPGARQAVPEEVGDDPIGGVGVVLRVCANVLGLVKAKVGAVAPYEPCCSLLDGLVDLEAVRLYGLGARKVVFNSLPPLGCIPSQRIHSGNGKCLDHVNEYAVEFNAAAKKLLNGMNDASPPLCPPPPQAATPCSLLPRHRRRRRRVAGRRTSSPASPRRLFPTRRQAMSNILDFGPLYFNFAEQLGLGQKPSG